MCRNSNSWTKITRKSRMKREMSCIMHSLTLIINSSSKSTIACIDLKQ